MHESEPITDMHPRRNRRRALAAVALVGALSAFAFSGAYFSSDDETGFDQLEAGTIVISSTDTGTWTGNYGNLLPGASVTSPITVDNDGTAALVYAISAEASDSLSGDLSGTFLQALRLQIFDGSCTTGTALLGSNVRMNNLGTIRGDPAAYTQTGDVYMPVDGSDDLCVKVTFVDTGEKQDELQAATADLTLTFEATQIDNNGSIAAP
jgi:spore coat-associated protein N